VDAAIEYRYHRVSLGLAGEKLATVGKVLAEQG